MLLGFKLKNDDSFDAQEMETFVSRRSAFAPGSSESEENCSYIKFCRS